MCKYLNVSFNLIRLKSINANFIGSFYIKNVCQNNPQKYANTTRNLFSLPCVKYDSTNFKINHNRRENVVYNNTNGNFLRNRFHSELVPTNCLHCGSVFRYVGRSCFRINHCPLFIFYITQRNIKWNCNTFKENKNVCKKPPVNTAYTCRKPVTKEGYDKLRTATDQSMKLANIDTINKLTVPAKEEKVKKPILTRIKEELMHIYHGGRLLKTNVKISTTLLHRSLKGHTLNRREKRLLMRTVGDLFRLVPFTIIAIVPFLEFALPVFLYIFPNMLPTTFETKMQKEAKMQKQLAVKIKMAKFLRDTLDQMTNAGKQCINCREDAKEFAAFFEKVRSQRGIATTEEILKFSRLFDLTITLQTLPRPQLIALCRMLEVKTIGTTNFLRFLLEMRLRKLIADDKVIQKEGVNSLNYAELQQACKARGMRALGVSEDELRMQLQHWIDLSINAKVPPSMLLMSRAFILQDPNAPSSPTKQISQVISTLPESTALQVRDCVSEGLDSKTRTAIIESEYNMICEEQKEAKESTKIGGKDAGTAPGAITADTACAIDQAARNVKDDLVFEREELRELKKKVMSHKQELASIARLAETSATKDAKAAERLFNITNKMTFRLDKLLAKLDSADHVKLKEHLKCEILQIDDLVIALSEMRTKPNLQHLRLINEILTKMVCDEDDGKIRVDILMKVIDLLKRENITLTKQQMTEIIELIKREEILTLEDNIETKLLEHLRTKKDCTCNKDCNQ